MFILTLVSIAVLFLLIIIGNGNSEGYHNSHGYTIRPKPKTPKPDMVPPSQKPKSRI
jgi:hypothetical protein